MKREEIIEKLKDILQSASDDPDVLSKCTVDAKLQTELGLTSVNMLYTVIAIEETFDIRFDDVTVTSFDTFGDVVEYGGLLGYCPIVPVKNQWSSEAFIARGGRIPAPVRSLTN